MFKTRLDILGTILGVFWFLNIFKNLSKTRPSLEHRAKKFLKKITPKHVQNTFGQIGNGFGRFLNFENFSKTFRRLDPPWNTGQKNFSKNLPQNMLKTRLDTFLNDFGHLRNFENFLIY